MQTSAPETPPEGRIRRLGPAWLRAAGIQSAAWLTVIALAQIISFPSLAHALAVQAALAGALALPLHAERWWPLLHLGFSPLLAFALDNEIDPLWWLAAFALCLLLFWGTPGTRVPLYLSGRAAVKAVDELLRERDARSMLDIGCGIASMLVPLSRRNARVRFAGIEAAPLPWLIAWLRLRGRSNASVRRGDFFGIDWADYDLVYAFLSPHPMSSVWDKANREMRAGAVLVSKDFPVPDVAPDRLIELKGGATLYLYEFGTRSD